MLCTVEWSVLRIWAHLSLIERPLDPINPHNMFYARAARDGREDRGPDEAERRSDVP